MMKTIYLALAAAIAIPTAAYAADPAPEQVCCCKKHEGKGCCDEATHPAGHGASTAPSHGPR